MPKSDTWPGGVAMESLSNMDSAGSCDSVISMNSTYSEDSMEYLSAEERACLMYLEETIESLEVQDDSGLSNDEPDPRLQTQNPGLTRANDRSSFRFGRGENHVLSSEPQSSTVSVVNGQGGKSVLNHKPNHNPPVPSAVAATQTKMLCVSTDRDGKPKIVTSPTINPGQSSEGSDTDLALIPPPSDFMDMPRPSAQLKKVKDLYLNPGVSRTKQGAVNLEELRQRASLNRTSLTPSVTQEEPNMASPEVSPSLSQPSPIIPGPQIGTLYEPADPRCPPVVAPKPKKLPSNIVLKSQKVSASSDGNAGHTAPSGSDRALLDPQKVRIEALRKLGLLKSEEVISGPALSPKHSPQTRRSLPAPPSPVSPGTPHTPPLTPSSPYVNSPLSAPVPLQSHLAVSPSANCSPPVVQYCPDILPAPAAFSDPIESLLTDNKLFVVEDVSVAKVNTQVNTPPLTPPALTKQLTPPKIRDVKSGSLERSGLGLSSYMTQDSSEAGQGVGGEESPSQLRGSRPRPASLGSRRDFAIAQGEGLQAGYAAFKESLPAHSAIQNSGESQKLPRSQGISVLICPRSENEEDRRKALKKLGLLRN